MLDVAFVQRRPWGGGSNNVEASITMSPPISGTGSRRRSLPARLGLATWRGRLAWLGALVVLVVVVCWMLARMTPAWYLPLDPADDIVQRVAGDAQNRAYTDLHNAVQRLPLGEQSWSISQDEVNALLAVKGDLGHGPADPFVRFAPGQITLSARVRQLPGADPRGGVGALTFSVGITREAGREPMGLVRLTRVQAGNLPLPRSVVEKSLQQQIPQMIAAVQQAVEMQFGSRPAVKARSLIEEIVRTIGSGQPFPLQYTWENRDFVIRELHVDEGRFTIVLAPVKPASVPRSATP
jgi:hypothetical protein